MRLPNQAIPVDRGFAPTATADAARPAYLGTIAAGGSMPATGVTPSGYEQCYHLTGPAQRTCLLMATN